MASSLISVDRRQQHQSPAAAGIATDITMKTPTIDIAGAVQERLAADLSFRAIGCPAAYQQVDGVRIDPRTTGSHHRSPVFVTSSTRSSLTAVSATASCADTSVADDTLTPDREGDYYWQYTVPYQPDAAQALQRLRGEVQARCEYSHAVPHRHASGRTIIQPAAGPLRRAEVLSTYSILDIDRVSQAHECGATTSLSDSQMRILFGTTRPTMRQVQAQMEMLQWMCEHRQSVHVTCHDNCGLPCSIVFVGAAPPRAGR